MLSLIGEEYTLFKCIGIASDTLHKTISLNSGESITIEYSLWMFESTAVLQSRHVSAVVSLTDK